jgi:hypothetical protein
MTRVWASAAAHLPDDCTIESDLLDSINDLQLMLMYAFVQAWFIDITDHRRFEFVFSKGRWYFFALYFLSGPVFSCIASGERAPWSLPSEVR